MKIPPYQNTELINLPDEQWKDIRGYEGYYQISNMGRVKSLPRERLTYSLRYHTTQRFMRKECILKQVLIFASTKTVAPNPHPYCSVTLTLPVKQTKRFLIHRLVYEHFKRSTTYNDDRTRPITHKNGINTDNRATNLLLTSFTNLHLKAFAEKRRVSHFTLMTDEERQRNTRKATKVNIKTISQYTIEGVLVQTYKSITIAAIKNKTTGATISNAALGRIHTAAGFIWRYGNGPSHIDTTKTVLALQNRCQKIKQPVAKLSLEGKRLEVYNSIIEAALAHGAKSTRQIRDVLGGVAKTAYGFRWRRLPKKKH